MATARGLISSGGDRGQEYFIGELDSIHRGPMMSVPHFMMFGAVYGYCPNLFIHQGLQRIPNPSFLHLLLVAKVLYKDRFASPTVRAPVVQFIWERQEKP